VGRIHLIAIYNAPSPVIQLISRFRFRRKTNEIRIGNLTSLALDHEEIQIDMEYRAV
jgi:hypothetical protein